VTLTLGDFARQLLLQLASGAPSGESLFSPPALQTGGLRAGWAQLVKGTIIFHGYSFVPGVTLSGDIKPEAAQLRIGGSAAAHGTLRQGAGGALVGTLGGRRVHIQPNAQGTAAIVGVDEQASSHFASGRAASRSVARQLARLIGRFTGG
jgi:hypothetical protein